MVLRPPVLFLLIILTTTKVVTPIGNRSLMI